MSENTYAIHEYLALLRHEIESNGGHGHLRTQSLVKEEKRIIDLMALALPPPAITVTAEEWERIKALQDHHRGAKS